MNKLFLLVFFLISIQANSQIYKGKMLDKKNNSPIAFVNIGVVNRDIGTVSDEDGNFSIDVSRAAENDSIRFSIIGYESKSFLIKNFKTQFALSPELFLEQQSIQLKEVIINPKNYKKKIVGNETKSRAAQAGFSQNKLGYEMGVLMSSKKNALLEKINLNVATCTYDTIFYRLNIYKRIKDREFKNILKQPIYFQFEKEKIKQTLQIDISKYNIEVKGDFLISVELVKELGEGSLFFCCSLFSSPTYYRETSQGEWRRVPMNIGIGINVEVMVEK